MVSIFQDLGEKQVDAIENIRTVLWISDVHNAGFLFFSFGAGDDEQTPRSSHDKSPKPVVSNLDNLVNSGPMEETCELLSEASMEVPVIYETNNSAAAGGSQGSCTMHCEELSHELSQLNPEDSLVGQTKTTVEKQQGRKLSSKYNRKSRGKR